ncbi:MAG: hypothetical protein LIO79_05430 [Rikenellaceae bacterium]|nr:hypothetical protein [Rikenellaceae bacterium]
MKNGLWLRALSAWKSSCKRLTDIVNGRKSRNKILIRQGELAVERLKFWLEDSESTEKFFGGSSKSSIRIIKVRDFTDALCFFLRLCDQRLLKLSVKKDSLHVHFQLPANRGTVEFSDSNSCPQTPNLLAVVLLDIPEITLREIRFVRADMWQRDGKYFYKKFNYENNQDKR